MKFDKFDLRQYADGWLLSCHFMRPRNSPSRRFTQADIQREKSEQIKNSEFAKKLMTLEEAVATIKSLSDIK